MIGATLRSPVGTPGPAYDASPSPEPELDGEPTLEPDRVFAARPAVPDQETTAEPASVDGRNAPAADGAAVDGAAADGAAADAAAVDLAAEPPNHDPNSDDPSEDDDLDLDHRPRRGAGLSEGAP
jgi:hypothetical protein